MLTYDEYLGEIQLDVFFVPFIFCFFSYKLVDVVLARIDQYIDLSFHQTLEQYIKCFHYRYLVYARLFV